MPGTRQAPKGRFNSAQCEALGKKIVFRQRAESLT